MLQPFKKPVILNQHFLISLKIKLLPISLDFTLFFQKYKQYVFINTLSTHI